MYKLVKSKEKPYFSITVSRKTDGITTIPRISPTDKRAGNNTTCYLIKTATNIRITLPMMSDDRSLE